MRSQRRISGILHEDPKALVPLLIGALDDADVDVRRASAGALGSFGEAAQPAIPALKKAMGDPDVDSPARQVERL